MRYNYNNNSSGDDDEGNIAWDLRRIYTEKIIGITLQEISVVRKRGDFSAWFKLLKRDLFTEISKELEEEEVKEVKNMITKITTILVAHPQTYTNKGGTPQSYQLVEDSLCELEMHLWMLMQKHKMFGQKDSYDEDEI